MGVVISIIVVFGSAWLLFALMSKATGKGIGTFSGPFVQPDDLDNVIKSVKKKIDPKFKRKKEYEEQLKKNMEPIDNEIRAIISNSVFYGVHDEERKKELQDLRDKIRWETKAKYTQN